MACVQLPKLKGFTMPERIALNIFRDPPKSIHTRKWEPINEGDIMDWVRQDDSRISENIMNYARGVNPAVSVEYGSRNAGGSKVHTMNLPQASNPYKVNDSFRPPLFRLEDLQPLSRLRRPYVYGITNPGVQQGFVDCGLENRMDHQYIQSATDVAKLGTYFPHYIPPTAVYKMDNPDEKRDITGGWIRDEPLNVPKSTSSKAEYFSDDFARELQTEWKDPKSIKDNTNIMNVITPLSDLMMDLNQERNINIKEKDNIFSGGISSNLNAKIYDSNNNDLSGIKIQDKENISVFSAPTNFNKLKNTYNPNFEFKNNMPSYAVSASVHEGYYAPKYNDELKELKSKIDAKYSSNPVSRLGSDMDDMRSSMRSKVKINKQSHYENLSEGFGTKPRLERDLVQMNTKERKDKPSGDGNMKWY